MKYRMERLENEMKKQIKMNKKLLVCCGIVFVFYFISHFFMDFSIGDDLYFYEKQVEGTIPFLISRFQGWSSRLIIEGVLINILHLPRMVFYILNSCIFVLIYYSILKITNTENNLKCLILLIVLMFTFPIKWFASAGWYATMLNYAWPLAFGLYSLYIVSLISSHEKFTLFQKIVYLPVLLFGTNQEQLCALLFGFTFLLNVYVFYHDRKINKVILSSWIITAVVLCVHMFCPGNAIRLADEIRTIYPEFETLTTVDKLLFGVLSTFSTMVAKPIVISIMLLFSLWICAYRKKDKTLLTIMSLIFVIFISFSMITFLVSKNILSLKDGCFSTLTNFILLFTANITDTEITSAMYLYLLVVVLFLILILWFMYKTMNKEKALFVGVVYLASLMSRFILGLSPSNFCSLTRTSINMYFFQMICIITILSKTRPLFMKNENLLENCD